MKKISKKRNQLKKKILCRKRSLCPRRAMKGTAILAAVLLTLYFSLCLCLDKGFLERDLEEKFGQVAGATTLTLRMIGPPHKPVMSAASLCQSYIAYMHLSWTADDQMDYFDIDKDGAPLVAGLIENSFDDQMVQELSSYTYAVTAFNPLGQNTSDPLSATVLDCGEPPVPPEPPIPPEPPVPIPIDPTCAITRFQNTNLAGFEGVPSTKERRPKFYGTTNMPNAVIEVVIVGETSMVATTTANQNGYWTWKPQNKLNYGTHTIWVTAIDPADSARKKTATLKFKINSEAEAQKEEQNKKAETAAPASGTVIAPVPVFPAPPENILELNLFVQVKNPDKVAYPGRKLLVETTINIVGEAAKRESEMQYWIVDENDNEVFRDSEKVFIDGDMTIEKELLIPRLLKPGKYKILTDVLYQGTRYVAEDAFTLKEVPLVSLGAGITVTTVQIMRNLLWVILWLLILLIVFFTLLAIERWLSRRAIIQITEETLRDRGLIIRK